MSKITLITNEKNWLEQTAINQLNNLENLAGVTKVVGLPDLHAGVTPVGIAVVTEGILYPYLIGSDIGCGMGLYKTNISKRKFNMERWVTKLNHIRVFSDLKTENYDEESCPIQHFGTIGGGNHFAEFQILDKVYNEIEFNKLNRSKEDLMLLIHSGSRDYGDRILNEFSSYTGYQSNSFHAQEYLKKHEDALVWAERNRLSIAEKLMDYLGFNSNLETIIDCKHNFLEQKNDFYIHRKGAVSASNGPVVIPGSRGSLTYIVLPKNGGIETAYSLSHGAGRKWARSLCRSRINNLYDRDTIRMTKLKSRVVCHDTNLLYEEAPEAYKNIDTVIDCLLKYDLIEIIATLKPVLTYKG